MQNVIYYKKYIQYTITETADRNAIYFPDLTLCHYDSKNAWVPSTSHHKLTAKLERHTKIDKSILKEFIDYIKDDLTVVDSEGHGFMASCKAFLKGFDENKHYNCSEWITISFKTAEVLTCHVIKVSRYKSLRKNLDRKRDKKKQHTRGLAPLGDFCLCIFCVVDFCVF